MAIACNVGSDWILRKKKKRKAVVEKLMKFK